MEFELKVGSIVRTKTTQYIWKYDKELNKHKHIAFEAGTVGRVHSIATDVYDGTVQVCIRTIPGHVKLKMAPWLLEKVEEA